MCAELQATQEHIKFLPILAGKRRRQKGLWALLHNIFDICKTLIGLVQSIYYIKRYQITIVFSKWGYVALPLVLAAKRLHVPLYVHESDTALWLANRYAARHATELFVCYPDLANNATLVWQLMSDDMTIDPTVDIINDLWLDTIGTSKTIVVVTWWSQGAQTLYTALLQALDLCPDLEKQMQFLIVGWLLNTDIQQRFAAHDACRVYDFLSSKELNALYSIADIAITRGWSTSLAELKLHNILLCIVPLPWTHDQTNNARYYATNYGDILIEQNKSTADAFQKTLQLLQHHKKGAQRNQVLREQVYKTKQTIAESLQKAPLL